MSFFSIEKFKKYNQILLLISFVIIIGITIKLVIEKEQLNNKNGELATKIDNLENKNFLSNTKDKTPNFSDYLSEDIDLSKYGAGVLQIGGLGSRIDQKTAWLLTETGYLKPAEDWVWAYYNRPADIITVGCRDGYTLISCNVNGEDMEVDDLGNCRDEMQDYYQNSVIIECIKDKQDSVKQ